MLKDWLSKLTDQYLKREDTNIGRILLIFDNELNQVRTTFETIENWRSINSAQGTTLDLTGENIGQPRGQASDEIYRIMIRGKEAQSQSDGTFNSILKVLSIALDCEPSEIQMQTIKEGGGDEPAALIITKAPMDALNRVGMTANQFVQLAQNSTLAGVRMVSANFEGTFSFGTVGEANDPNAGFGNIAGTTGGYFGAVVTPDNETDLPI